MLSLEDIWTSAWTDLVDAAARAKNPWHTAVVATYDGNQPQLRTVVLRGADRQSLTLSFHTDRRSPKHLQLQAAPGLSWLFYDAQRKIQLRASGAARLHWDDELAEARWQAGAWRSHQCYQTPVAPGEPCEGVSAIPQQQVTQSGGRENFVVVTCQVSHLDWLQLNATGHLRAGFDCQPGRGDGSQMPQWQGAWIAA